MVAMETRMERYAKYRESIKRMAPEEFETRKGVKKDPEQAESLPDYSYDSAIQEGVENESSGPYSLYLRRRRKWLILKVVCLVLAIAGFLVWWFLMQGRF